MKNTEGVPRGRGLAAPESEFNSQTYALATANIVTFQKEYLSVMKEMKRVGGHLGGQCRAGGWPWNNNQAEKLSLSEKQYFLGNICLSH
jgi:hypothetical protein